MAATVVEVDTAHPDPAIIERAGAVIRAGGLVAFPTETVYGLGANALDPAAVARIFAAKGRPANDPVIVHIASREQLAQVTSSLPPLAEPLIAAEWPGPLTLILPRASAVPPAVSAGLPTVAVRMPAHPVALALITAAGTPVAAPSANRFSRPSATTAAHVLADLGDAVDLILDGGPALIGIESTILDISGDGPPRLLRPGGVPIDRLRHLIGAVALPATTDVHNDDQAQTAPGLLSRHYSPTARVVYVTGDRCAARERLRREMTAAVAAGQRLGVLLVEEDADLVADLPAQIEWLGSEAQPALAAERLFAAIRRLDAAAVDLIAARDLGDQGLWLAIRDRLTRAAAGQVIRVTDDA